MKNTIKKICLTLLEDCPESLNGIYMEVKKQLKSQPNYFSRFSTAEKFEIVYGIFSLKQTGRFDLAEQILPNIKLVSIFNFLSDDFAEIDCPKCEGGENRCKECNMFGVVKCDDCDGEGSQFCYKCYGTGEYGNADCDNCRGTGQIGCKVCNGDSMLTCPECGGDKVLTCNECGGQGMLESEQVNFNLYDYIIYDKNILRYLFDRAELFKPIGENSSFSDSISSNENILHLGLRFDTFEPKLFVQEKDYCYFIGSINDEEKINWNISPSPIISTLPHKYVKK